VPLACQRFSEWSYRCGDFSYSCDGESCYTDEDSLCAYVDPEAAGETIKNACVKGRDMAVENSPEDAEAMFERYDACTGCMQDNLGEACYFPNTIPLEEGMDESQLGWLFLAPDCEAECLYEKTPGSGGQSNALNELRNLIGFNLTPEDLQTTLKTVCDAD